MDILEQAIQIVREQEVKAIIGEVVSVWQRAGRIHLIACHQEWAVVQLGIFPDISAQLCNGTVTLEQLHDWLYEEIRERAGSIE